MFRGEVPVEFIDWDLAAPGTTLYDIAHVVWYWVPLLDAPERRATNRSACASSVTLMDWPKPNGSAFCRRYVSARRLRIGRSVKGGQIVDESGLDEGDRIRYVQLGCRGLEILDVSGIRDTKPGQHHVVRLTDETEVGFRGSQTHCGKDPQQGMQILLELVRWRR